MNVDEIMKKFGKNADLLKKGEPLEFANDANDAIDANNLISPIRLKA